MKEVLSLYRSDCEAVSRRGTSGGNLRVSASFRAARLRQSQGLPVDLPSAQTAEPEQSVQLNITIEPDGKMFLDRQPIELDNLKAALTEKIQPDSESVVIINADEKVEHGTVVKVMDRLRQVPGAKI